MLGSRYAPDGTAYVIGEGGLLSALHEVNYATNREKPGYLIVGEGLVLTGSTTREELKAYPFAPTYVVESIAELAPALAQR